MYKINHDVNNLNITEKRAAILLAKEINEYIPAHPSVLAT